MRTFLSKVVSKIRKHYFRLLTVISPTLNTKAKYWTTYKKKLDLNKPENFKEKLLTLKLKRYIKDPLVVQCADKYAVRKYLEDKGCQNIIIPLIAVYDDASEIDWDKLPNSFALKWNFGCGFNIICSDINKLDKSEAVRKLNKWKKSKYHLDYSEMQYKKAPKKIIIEKYLRPLNGELPADYKVYCFNGEPQAILYMCDRGTEQITAGFFDKEWNFLSEVGKKYKKFTGDIDAPSCLKDMINISRKLSEPFEFVRIDYYVIDEKLYFGEMTFTPAGGMHVSECMVNGKTMGELLDVSKYTKNNEIRLYV